jgi:hypothetical protein
MIFAYAVPSLGLMIASLYLMMAVPIVIFASVLIFILFQLRRFGVFSSPCIPNCIIPFSLLNIGLSFYFIDLGNLKLTTGDSFWMIAQIASLILLILSSWQSQKAKRSTEQDAAANP